MHALRCLMICALLTMALVQVAPAVAHNGAVAVALPVTGITVDGDLSDWPQDARRYDLKLMPGFSVDGPADLSASFTVGWNASENALYVAVFGRDESTVVDSTLHATQTQDGLELFIASAHGDSTAPARHWELLGDQRMAYHEHRPVPWAGLELAVQRRNGRFAYEGRIDFAVLGVHGEPLHAGRVLGFDLIVTDRDQSDPARNLLYWAKPDVVMKATDPAFRGDVVLAASERSLGTLEGRVTWKKWNAGAGHALVRLAVLPSRDWCTIETDRQGGFRVRLPAGRYAARVERPWRGAPVEHEVVIRPGTREEVDLPLSQRLGETVPAGPGVARAAGGYREGAWYTLNETADIYHQIFQDHQGTLWTLTDHGVHRFDGTRRVSITAQDGLAADMVMGVVEDDHGDLWFATHGGVSRYDGHSFTNYTVADGLVDNHVGAILRDRHGDLWFATLGGVSCYDGRYFTNYTMDDGLADNTTTAIAEDGDGNIWIGLNFGFLSRFDGTSFTNFTDADGLPRSWTWIHKILFDRRGMMWMASWPRGLIRYDGRTFTFGNTGTWGNWDAAGVFDILEDRDGLLWFASWNGVVRYDGATPVVFSSAEGLVDDQVFSLLEDREDNLWAGTMGGLSRYDKGQITTFPVDDGLMVLDVLEDRNGDMWFGSLFGKGALRYDGKDFTTYTVADGLGSNSVTSIYEDSKGNLWFGCAVQGGWGYTGVSRFDGKTFRVFTTEDGLSSNHVCTTFEDRDGNLWFGMHGEEQGGSVTRYDGRNFVSLTRDDGLPGTAVAAITQDGNGNLWFGTWGGGVCRYDGADLTCFTTEDGLLSDNVLFLLAEGDSTLWVSTEEGVCQYDGKRFSALAGRCAPIIRGSIIRDHDGFLWFTTYNGLFHTDGRVLQSIRRQDGLASNLVTRVIEDHHGDIWIATAQGVDRYRPTHTPPAVCLSDLVADRRYGSLHEIRLPSSQKYLAFEFQGSSLTTLPDRFVYVYRLQGYDKDWRQTRDNRAEYTDLPRGTYTFEVKAVDKDLNYSKTPATVRVVVHLPYRHAAVIGLLCVALMGLAYASGVAVRRRRAFLREQQARLRAQEQLNQDLEDELRTAHDMQMRLMPEGPPRIRGLDISGQCLTANHVGGDFFQYFQRDGKLLVCVADVTGHAMEAAIPVVMFSGILESQMEIAGKLGDLFGRLNRSLCRTLDRRTFVCFAMAELHQREPETDSAPPGPSSYDLRFANAGCPYPYHFRAATGDVAELVVDAYPLGVSEGMTYSVLETRLAPGDYLVFCSDGIIEAMNADGELLGFDRVARMVEQACAAGPAARILVEDILAQVQRFAGDVPQGDDQTIVVLKLAG